MPQLQSLQLTFGRTGAQNQPFQIAFDPAFPTQKLLHDYSARNELIDPPLTKALTDFLQPGDTFVDVGSHIGYFALLALQMLSPGGSVFMFEPNPQTYAVLLTNAMLNRHNHAYAYNCAVGDEVTSATFNINLSDEGMSSLLFRAEGSPQVTVHVTTLDHVAAVNGIRFIRMLKIDVEGFEEQVLRGAKNLLQAGAIESLVYEVNNVLPGMPTGRDAPIRQFLNPFGYSHYLIRPAMGEPGWLQKFGPHNYYKIAGDAPVDIRYGNILSTRRAVEAAG